MSFPNPTINPPTLYSSRPRLHSRSPSRSPIRHARDFDPLLRDLSPTTTLRAFTTDASSVSGKHDSAISTSFETASTSERALGAKAAQTCLDLRSWTRELESWEWPGTLDVPEPARKRMRMSGMSIMSSRTTATSNEEDEDEHWGSLPAKTVRAYEQRTDEIGQHLDEIDVEELKGYVLSAHQQAGSGRASMDDSISSINSATDIRKLDDFTALITATILQALPYLSRLYRLLDVWTLRLSILRKTPPYLWDLKQARTDLDHGWAAIAVSSASAQGSTNASFTRETMMEMQSVIQQQVTSLGRRLDNFLDELEGREETVPEVWIEDFETLEEAYGDWVVQAERKVQENEWRMSREQELNSAEYERTAQQLKANHAGLDRKISASYNLENPARDEEALVSPSSRPTSGIFGFAGELPGLSPPIAGSKELAREDSDTLPGGREEQVMTPKGPDDKSVVPELTHGIPTRQRSKHVPIILDYDGDGQLYKGDGMSGSNSAVDLATLQTRAVSEPLTNPLALTKDAPETVNAVKKRAAFLDANVNRDSSLQKQVKSPVRSFEHASNAFTRLFSKRTSGERPGQSRENSQLSTATASSKRSSNSSSKAAAKGEEIVWGGRKSPLGRVSSGGSKGPNVPDAGRSRSRSASQRSLGRHSSKPSLTDPFSLERLDSNRSAVRDYPDMPGGFRPRSKSEQSLRARSRTPKAEHEGEVMRLRSTHRAPVETYQPKRLSSPFGPPSAKSPEHDYPADWPLASPPETEANSPVKESGQSDADAIELVAQEEREDSSPDIVSPRIPLETDVFDRMFVESFPNTPEPTPDFAGNPMERFGSSRTTSGTSVTTRRRKGEPTLDSAMLGADGRHVDDYLSIASPGPSSPQKRSKPQHADEGTDRTSGANGAKAFGGDVQDARSIDYFHSQPSTEALSRASSSATAKNVSQQKAKTSSVNPMLLRLQIPDAQADTGANAADDDEDEDDERPVLYKRASRASIQSRPRSELRTLDVTRSRRNSAASSAPQTPQDSAPVSAIEPTGNDRMPGSPLGYNGLVFFPSPPGARPSFPTSPVSPISAEHSPTQTRFAGLPRSAFADVGDGVADSPVSARSVSGSPAPLNAAMAKRQGRRTANSTTSSPKKPMTPLKPGEDSFDRHISEVLERLPSAAIKFRPRSGAVTPSQRTSEPRNYSGPRPKGGRLSFGKASTSGGGGDLTLAPAETLPKKTAGETDVKLYHLTQAGREEPIKLFVRLVGEGERVMVRVGGGWADLADYLRQYAEHHGSRTVSGSGLEVQTAGGTPAGTGSRKVSGSTAEPKSKTPVTPATAIARPSSRAADIGSNDELQPGFNLGGSTPMDDESPIRTKYPTHQQTPTNTITSQRSTPKSTSTKGSSRPSTADSLGRPGSRQGQRTDAGLSGAANGKRPDLPEQKARWVEGMIEKAKATASAEKSKEEKAKFFGEMGKAGGTRRVMFRQSSGAMGNNENAKP